MRTLHFHLLFATLIIPSSSEVFQPENWLSLRTALDSCYYENINCENIGEWDTSKIQSLDVYSLKSFYNSKSTDMSCWSTSSVNIEYLMHDHDDNGFGFSNKCHEPYVLGIPEGCSPKQCTCPSGLIFDGKNCKCPTSGHEEINGICQCPDSRKLEDGTCCRDNEYALGNKCVFQPDDIFACCTCVP